MGTLQASLFLVGIILAVDGQITEFRVIDRYFDHVTLLYYGATLEILCECSKLCETDQPMKLLLNDKPIASTKDHKPNTTVAFKLKIDDSLKSGSYSCSLPGVPWKSAPLEYRLCNPATCNKLSSCSKEKACHKSLSEAESCAAMNTDYCARISGRRVCTVERTQVDSLCHAMFGIGTSAVAEVSRENTCEFYRSGVYAFFSELLTSEYKPIPMGTYMYSVGILKPRCSGAMENRQADIEVRFSLPQREKVFNAKARCGVNLDAKSIIETNFKLPAATIKILLNYTDTKDTNRLKGYESYFFFVVMSLLYPGYESYMFIDKPQLTINVPESGKCSEHLDSVTCNVVSKFNLTNYFEFSLILELKIDGATILTANDKFVLSTESVDKPGVYSCKATLQHKSACDPVSTSSVESEITRNVDESCITPEKLQQYQLVKEADSSMKSIAAAGGVIGLLVLIIIILIIIFIIKRWKGSKRNPVCLRSLRSDLPENHDNILRDKELIKLSELLLKKTNEFAAAKAWVKSKLGTKEDDEKRYVETKLAVHVPDSRYMIECFKSTQAFPDLHVSRMEDWYCNPLLVSMAPLRQSFTKFWDLIITHDVGNIAWIGNLDENGVTKIDPYIPLKADISVVYEDAKIDNYKVEVKTTRVQDNKAAGKFIVYDVEAKLTRADKSTDSGKVVITHVLDWPDHDIPRIDDVSNLYRHCANIENSQKMSSSNCVLFHCSAGVQRSVAMVALYICRQIYIEKRAVNLVGVLKYIRSMRYGSFLWARYGYIQVPLIVGNLVALDASLQSSHVPIAASPEDRKAFQAWAQKSKSSAWTGTQSSAPKVKPSSIVPKKKASAVN